MWFCLKIQDNKKFCLIINKSGLNNDVFYFQEKLKLIDNVDNINLYNEYICYKSCYHSLELLDIFNQYKFILCIENSYSDGYITEKIFNCFFAKTIPLYKGSSIIKNYLNELSFIDLNNEDKSFKTIEMLNNNEEYYNKIIETYKISSTYDDENYKEELYKFIENRLNHWFFKYINDFKISTFIFINIFTHKSKFIIIFQWKVFRKVFNFIKIWMY